MFPDDQRGQVHRRGRGMVRLIKALMVLILVATYAAAHYLTQRSATKPSLPNSAAVISEPDSSGPAIQAALGGSEDDLAVLSDRDLLRRLNESPANQERNLIEVIHRGGKFWEYALTELVDAAAEDLTKRDRISSRLLLTALRRLQRKPDPLSIKVDGPQRIDIKVGGEVWIQASLTNTDFEKRPMWADIGGDNRTAAGRENRWRLDVYDDQNKPLPMLKYDDMGGLVYGKILKFGEGLRCSFCLDSYVWPERPGTYKIVVTNHPLTRIAMEDNADGRICWTSQPITLVVHPIEVRTTHAEQDLIHDLIRDLPLEGKVQIVDGPPDPELEDYLPRRSVGGRLKSIGWPAVPQLIAAINQGKLTVIQRSWAIGLLYVITHRHNPFTTDDMDVVSPCELRSSLPQWSPFDTRLRSKRDAIAMSDFPANEESQLQFARGWTPWLDKPSIRLIFSDDN